MLFTLFALGFVLLAVSHSSPIRKTREKGGPETKEDKCK